MTERINDEVDGEEAANTTGDAEPKASGLSIAGAAGAERDRNMAIAAVLAYIAYSVFVPLLRLPHLHGMALQAFALGAMLVSTLVFMYLQLWMPRTIVHLRPKPVVAVVAVVLCVVGWYLLYTAGLRLPPYSQIVMVHGSGDSPFLYQLEVVSNKQLIHQAFRGIILTGPLYALRTAFMGILLTLGLTYLGTMLSRIIREANVLLPVAFVAMPIDYIGAMTPTGYTHDMVKHHPNLVQNVSVSVPVMHGVHPIGFIGPGDVLFIAFFLAVAVNLSLNEPLTFKLMYVFLTATMLLVTFGGLNIAALVPMGLAVLAANYKHFKLERSEVFASIYAMLIVLALIVAFYMYSHHHFFGGK